MSELDRFAGQRVCFLNWRDTSHPDAGGAETFCERVATRFAAAGATVTLFTSAFPGCAPTEHRDGIRIVRRGGVFGVYARAAAHLSMRNRHDAVIDIQNGIPFFAPLFRPALPTVLLIHHVHQEQFGHRFSRPLSAVGRALEGPVSRRVYGSRPIVSVSPSTRKDVRLRLGMRGPIHVAPCGLDPITTPRRRTKHPRLAIVTRLAPQKRLHLLVETAAKLQTSWPDLEVCIGGTGPEHDRIDEAVRAYGMQGRVRLLGRLDDTQRDELLASAWLTALPSEAEGWGLTVLEANSAGVPAVALDVAGLRDAVVEGQTGWLASLQSLTSTVDRALAELADVDRARLWERRCRDWASTFSWDRTAEVLARVLSGEVERTARASTARDRRRHRDVSVVGWIAPSHDSPAVAAARLRATLRATDEVEVDKTDVVLSLHGADEEIAHGLMARAGVRGLSQFRVMRPQERLCGPIPVRSRWE